MIWLDQQVKEDNSIEANDMSVWLCFSGCLGYSAHVCVTQERCVFALQILEGDLAAVWECDATVVCILCKCVSGTFKQRACVCDCCPLLPLCRHSGPFCFILLTTLFGFVSIHQEKTSWWGGAMWCIMRPVLHTQKHTAILEQTSHTHTQTCLVTKTQTAKTNQQNKRNNKQRTLLRLGHKCIKAVGLPSGVSLAIGQISGAVTLATTSTAYAVANGLPPLGQGTCRFPFCTIKDSVHYVCLYCLYRALLYSIYSFAFFTSFNLNHEICVFIYILKMYQKYLDCLFFLNAIFFFFFFQVLCHPLVH